jgi:CrcB protein
MPDDPSPPGELPEEVRSRAADGDGALPLDPESLESDAAPAPGEAGISRSAHPLGLLASVALGGSLGALARYGIETGLPTPSGQFPVATFIINLTGSLLIGAVLVVLVERLPHHPYARPLIVSGILGGYTTFSTFMVEAFTLARGSHVADAVAYLVSSLVLGLVAVLLGMRLARGLLNRDHRSRAVTRSGEAER